MSVSKERQSALASLLTHSSVELLLNHPRINDTIRDEQGRTALECAADHEVASAIEGKLNACLRRLSLK